MYLRSTLRGILGGCLAFVGLSGFVPSTSQAQLDVFENNTPRSTSPTARRGIDFGQGFRVTVGGTGGKREVREGSILYAQGNYSAASLKFFRVVKNYKGSSMRPIAEFQLAKCLFRMNMFQPAMHYFTEVVKGGRNHPHFRDAIVFLAEIGAKINNTSFLGKMNNFSPADLPQKYRNQLFYLLGKYYYTAAHLARGKRLPIALNLLMQVNRNEPIYYSRAQYIVGAIYDAAEKPNIASQYFRRAGQAALRIEDSKMRQNVVELALMGLARIHYGAKHFRGAIKYYKAIHRSSPRWLDAMFEMSYTYLRRGMYGHTLGILHTLESPYFRNEYYPEAGILRALSFFERCRYREVKEIIKRYTARYKPLVKAIDDFLQQNPNSRRVFGALQNMRNQEVTGGLDNDESAQMFSRLLKLTFQDKALRAMFAYIRELDTEISLIQQQSSVWQSSSLARSLQSSLNAERLKYVNRAGSRARQRFLDAKSELQGFIGQALKIRYETFGAEKIQLERSVSQRGGFTMRQRGTKRKRTMITVSTHEDFVFWPFQGEYWVDELGYYRYRLRGECRKP